MPRLELADGVELHWDQRGEGPLVVVANQFFGEASVFEALISDLASDHRVVLYDIRGTGRSTRRGPYDLITDAADLGAVIEEAGGPAVVVAMADGCNRAVRLTAERPELVRAVVSPGGNPAGREALEGTDGLAGSDSVLDALMSMMATDYRGALRTILSNANPQLPEDAVRRRVDATAAYCSQDAAVGRLRAWIGDNSREQARALGDRLWLLEHGNNPWFSIELVARTRELLPEAHVEQVPDGPLSRPDITAGIVRGITAGSDAAPVLEGRDRAV